MNKSGTITWKQWLLMILVVIVIFPIIFFGSCLGASVVNLFVDFTPSSENMLIILIISVFLSLLIIYYIIRSIIRWSPH